MSCERNGFTAWVDPNHTHAALREDEPSHARKRRGPPHVQAPLTPRPEPAASF